LWEASRFFLIDYQTGRMLIVLTFGSKSFVAFGVCAANFRGFVLPAKTGSPGQGTGG